MTIYVDNTHLGRHVTGLERITLELFSEAALGTKLTVPTLDGEQVTLKIPEGTPSGKVFRVKGRGVKAKKSTGDLLVTVQITVPRKLSKQQREAVEAFAAATTDSPREHLGV